MLPKQQSLKSRAELPTGNTALYKVAGFQIINRMAYNAKTHIPIKPRPKPIYAKTEG
nr:MAG TPA: hypothetical protein [Caudoviricetes sp.]